MLKSSFVSVGFLTHLEFSSVVFTAEHILSRIFSRHIHTFPLWTHADRPRSTTLQLTRSIADVWVFVSDRAPSKAHWYQLNRKPLSGASPNAVSHSRGVRLGIIRHDCGERRLEITVDGRCAAVCQSPEAPPWRRPGGSIFCQNFSSFVKHAAPLH